MLRTMYESHRFKYIKAISELDAEFKYKSTCNYLNPELPIIFIKELPEYYV